jgi:DNA-binding LacI/PurR family transcriptional regulator
MMPTDRTKTVTIADVARAAHVSTATVSLVVNGQANSLRISETTRNTVQDAVRRLGYTPNHAARSLRSRRTGTLALIVTQVDIPHHGELATAAVAAAELRGFDLHVLEARSPEHECRLLDRLRGGQVDGVLAATVRSLYDQDGRPVDAELVRRQAARASLAHSGVPVVVLFDRSPDARVPAVRIDDAEGAYLATQHLIQQGHRRIADICLRTEPPNDDDVSASADRFRGYRRALHDAGISFEPALLVPAQHGPRLAAGHTLGARWRSHGPAGVTAAFVANDLIAIGFLRGLDDAGMCVPNDLAIAAFGGTELSRYTRPSLTTVDHRRAEVGQIGTETLVGLIEGRPAAQLERVLPVTLTIRESSVVGLRARPDAASAAQASGELPARLPPQPSCEDIA